MKNKEMLKATIMTERMKLAMLLANAREDMDDSDFENVECEVRRLHLHDNNNDLEGSLEATQNLITKLSNNV
tara:strand:- start:87 stop:302 length:216 start_codon:yes stop_codon:yes gene_type:complete